MPEPGAIRPIAVCLFEDRGRLFVGQYADPTTGQTFHRPLGGALLFGERGRDCLARELSEEMGAGVRDLTYVGVLENLFTYDGKPHHEIVLVFRGSFVDDGIYQAESVLCQDDDGEFTALWRPMADFETGKAVLYPEGLLDLLRRRSLVGGGDE